MRATCCIAFLMLVSFNTIICVSGQRFNDYVEILRLPINTTFKIRIIKSFWCEVLADHIADLNKATLLYKEVVDLISSDPDHQSLYELQQQMRRYLIAKAGEELANVFNSRKNSADILKTHTFFLNNYELELLQVIYAKAIDEIQLFGQPEKLASHIRQIHHKGNASEKSLALTLHTQIHLFRRLKERNAVGDNYRFHVAYYLYTILHDSNYSRLDEQLRTLLTNIAKQFPKALRFLFLEESFCLSNDKAQYLYTGYVDVNIDEERRYVLLWIHPDQVGSQGDIVPEITETSGEVHGEMKLKFALKSKDFDIYWYLEPKVQDFRNIIAGWRPGNKPVNSDWNVKLVNNKLVFEQNGYLMCNSGNFEPKDPTMQRILLNAYKDESHSAQTTFCQWSAGECPP